MELQNKYILDACCGARMMWNNKNHPNTLYIDIRKEQRGFVPRGNWEINPDIVADFTNLPDEIKSHKFKLIVWDVPHFKARKLTGDLLKKFGGLNPETWQSDLKKGFNQLWNILDDFGVLLFKFSDYHIKFKEVLGLFPEEPLFFNKTNSTAGKSTTKWFCFMKIPKHANSPTSNPTDLTLPSAKEFNDIMFNLASPNFKKWLHTN
jgi:hypothetical protein